MTLISILIQLLKMFVSGGQSTRSAPVGIANTRSGGDPYNDDNSRDAMKQQYGNQTDKAIPGNVKMISGCKDSQTSADVGDVSRFGLPNSQGAGGACTNAILKTVHDSNSRGHGLTWLSLLKGSRRFLKGNRFTQVPQLSTSKVLDLNSEFTITPGHGQNKSLLIGINYVGQQGALNGCHNDCISMARYLQSIGFSDDGNHMRFLMDDGRHPNPDAANITASIHWLVSGAKAGDNLFMHYSGHGGSIPDDDGDESDHMDETLIPVDFQRAGQMRDDDIFDMLVKRVPTGCNLTVIMDCCHSGTILDLPFLVNADDMTIEAVECGRVPSVTQPNPFFTARMMKLGIELVAMGMEMHGGGGGSRDMQKQLLSSMIKMIG